MSDWSEEDKKQMRIRLDSRMIAMRERILEYRELTKPIPPENAIGRVSRMDAINNRSVNEAALINIDLADNDSDADDGLNLASITIIISLTNVTVTPNLVIPADALHYRI